MDIHGSVHKSVASDHEEVAKDLRGSSKRNSIHRSYQIRKMAANGQNHCTTDILCNRNSDFSDAPFSMFANIRLGRSKGKRLGHDDPVFSFPQSKEGFLIVLRYCSAFSIRAIALASLSCLVTSSSRCCDTGTLSPG